MPIAIALVSALALKIDSYEALRSADAELATIGYRLTIANTALCDKIQPALGLAVHARAQYADQAAAARTFGLQTPVAVEAVVAGSPADAAGIRPDDGIIAVNGKAVPQLRAGVAERDLVLDWLEDGAPEGAHDVQIQRENVTKAVRLKARPACRARFELLLGSGTDAGSDGRVIHLGERLFERLTPEEIAVIAAHELAHIVLHHRERLEAAGVNWGILRELGRNGRLFRETETEADELSIYLLANAGYDPFAAARFWRRSGRALEWPLVHAGTHPSARARAEALQSIAETVAAIQKPAVPQILKLARTPLQ